MNEEVLVRWYKTHKIAEENPRLLCKNVSAEESTRIGDLCAQRMRDCAEADEELFKLENIPLLNLFKEAAANRTHCSCHFMSSRKDFHEDCWNKSKEWFAYREALMAYVYQRYILYTEHMLECPKMDRAEDITDLILSKVGRALDIPSEIYADIESYLVHLIMSEL